MDEERIEDFYYVLKEFEGGTHITQRSIAHKLGFSLGKVNYVLKALVEKGIVKMERFRRSDNKLYYRYILTPTGMREKLRITKEFIKRKSEEFERIRREIEEAKRMMEVSDR